MSLARPPCRRHPENGDMAENRGRTQMVPDFAVVVAVAESDAAYIPKSLPAWLALPSREVIICVDSPVSQKLRSAIQAAAGNDPRLRLVEVPKNPSWNFHQALVRRTGFRDATTDRILTGDIDVVPEQVCVRAVSMVGLGNVGLVSLSKERGEGGFDGLVRNWTRTLTSSVLKRAHFTGLYALYRPYWQDSEVDDEVRRIPHPESPGFAEKGFPYRGEDAILRDYMLRRHKVVYLSMVGGTDLRVALGDRPVGQVKLGVMYAREGRALEYVLPRAIAYARPMTMGAYAITLAREHGSLRVVTGYFEAIPGLVKLLVLSVKKSRALNS